MKNCSTGRCERPASQRVVESCSAGADIPPSMAGGPGPAPGGIRPLRPHEGIRCTPTGPGTHDGVSIWHRRRSLALKGPVDATASNLDTLLDRGIGRRVRMLLSFQRPSHLWGRGFLPTAHPEPFRFRSGPLSIAPVPPSWEVSGRGLLIVPAVSPERVLGVSAFRRSAFSHRCEPDLAPRRDPPTRAPGQSPSAGGDGRRSRSAPPAARSRASDGRRAPGSSPRDR